MDNLNKKWRELREQLDREQAAERIFKKADEAERRRGLVIFAGLLAALRRARA